jgi:TonB family protein
MKRSSLMTFSVAAHVAVAVGLGAIQVRKSHTPTPVELVDVKRPPPEKEKPPEEPPKPKPPPSQRPVRPRASARAATPTQSSPTPRLAGFDGMPDFGVALSGTGDGIAIPVADQEMAPSPPPQVKTLAAPPRLTKTTKACTDTLTKPIPISVPRPEFPPAVRDFAGDGKVRVRLTIDETGQVVSAVILSGMRDEFNEAALAAARRARFEPGTQCGSPVAAHFTIAMRFSSG